MTKYTIEHCIDEGSNNEDSYWIVYENGFIRKYVYDPTLGLLITYQVNEIEHLQLENARLREAVRGLNGIIAKWVSDEASRVNYD